MRQVAVQPEFGPRYRVVGVIGKGGMGEVYRAYDAELKVEVALKIVRGDSEQDEALARFRREIALARKVTSPNVLRIYDLEEHEGLRFLSMELVEGEDLAAIMKRDGKLSVERALKLFRQVCTGLAAAHAEGVVHRDLKPQNVLVDKTDRVHVADFGLARSIGDSGMTASGAVLGSPAYMSPEQVKGDAVDERSDIYSLGVMLYQLLVGATPFQADTPHAVMEMRLHKPPRPLGEVAPDAPSRLAGIVARCLAIEPGKRYASIRELLDELDAGGPRPVRSRARRWWPAVLAVGLAGGAIAVMIVRGGQPANLSATPEESAAVTVVAPTGPVTALVLAFDNRTSQPELDTADIVIEYALRRSRRVDPIGGELLRISTDELGPEPPPLDDRLGKAFAAHGKRVIVVHGAAAAKGAGASISLSATDGATGATVYSSSLDAPTVAAMVPTIGRLATGLLDALGDHTFDDKPTVTGLSVSLEADHEFALGRRFHQAGNDTSAIPRYQAAIALDPEFAVGHAFLAMAEDNLTHDSDARKEFANAFELASRFNERDRLYFLGNYYGSATGESDRAVEAYRDLLAIWPDDLPAQVNLVATYSTHRDNRRSLEIAERAVRAHPHNFMARSNFVSDLVMVGRFDEAVAEAQRITNDFPRVSADLYLFLGVAEYYRGHLDAALAAFKRLRELDPAYGALAVADLTFAEGEATAAASQLERAIADDRTAHRVDYRELDQLLLAKILLARGDQQGALQLVSDIHEAPGHVYNAALIELAAGAEKRALARVERLRDDPAPAPRAYGKLIQAEIARSHGQTAQAIALGHDAIRVLNLWQAHLVLGEAFIDGGRFPEAKVELDTCYARRGEIGDEADMVIALDQLPELTGLRARAAAGK
jgi:tetratricopeptide (TPR) repeat protein